MDDTTDAERSPPRGSGARSTTEPSDTRAAETIVVAGAGGDTGRELLALLDHRPVTVRGITRREENRQSLYEQGADEVVVGDLFDPADAARAADGADVVVSAVGSSVADRFGGGDLVDGVGNRNLLAAAVDAGARAFVMESALGVGPEPTSALGSFFNRLIEPIQSAKAETEAALREADIRHTIFRAGLLTNGRRRDAPVVAEPGAKLWGPISRADVARLLAAAAYTDAAANRTFEVVDNPSCRDRGLSIDWRVPWDDRRTVVTRQ